jgi:hypothetical protein
LEYKTFPCHEALELFNEVKSLGIKNNSITMVSVMPTCADLLALEQGKQIHAMESLLVIPRFSIPINP